MAPATTPTAARASGAGGVETAAPQTCSQRISSTSTPVRPIVDGGDYRLLETACGGVKLLALDMGVAGDRREVRVADVPGGEPGVAELLPEPARWRRGGAYARC